MTGDAGNYDQASGSAAAAQRIGQFGLQGKSNLDWMKRSGVIGSAVTGQNRTAARRDYQRGVEDIAKRKQEVSGRVNGMMQERDRLNNSITYLQGALEDIDYMTSIWSGVHCAAAR
mgnify:CR=1 FL=1